MQRTIAAGTVTLPNGRQISIQRYSYRSRRFCRRPLAEA
jgi:hypothetical protein